TKIENSAEEVLFEYSNTNPKASQILVMPSFNSFLGGRQINKEASLKGGKIPKIIGPVLRSRTVDLGTSEIHLLDQTYPGTLNQLINLN
ncbi:hypothetical protein KAI12_05290, partial [Candidatus Bathyarchaeota archaeon]|nr:hypothetical protein [Candidatus Bathyarchaeota archaeon]